MLKHFIQILLLSTLCLAQTSLANPLEIKQLLNFIEQSNCIYQRNGDDYTGKEALEHIKKKYNYFIDDIKTTEDFIRLSATKSTISGKPYMVKCEGQAIITSEQWLLEALKQLRNMS